MKPLFTFLLLCHILFVTAQWRSMQGPFGGEIFDYANEGKTTYVAAFNGLYRSDDNGDNWIKLQNDLPEFYTALSFASDGDELFLNYKEITDEKTYLVYSADQGQSWKQVTMPTSEWTAIDMSYSNGVLLAFGGDRFGVNNLVESKDKGLSWQPAGLSNVYDIKDVVSNKSYFFVSDKKSLYRKAIHDTLWVPVYSVTGNYFDVCVNDVVVILTHNIGNARRSVDNGGHWNQIGIYNTNGPHTIADFGNIMYYGTMNLYKSYDRGLTWDQVRVIRLNDNYIRFIMRAGSSLIANTIQSGLVLSDDEFASTKQINKGIFSSEVMSIVATDSFLFTMGIYKVDRYDLRTKNWYKQSPNIFFLNNICFYMGKLFALTYDTLYISDDLGLSYKKQEIEFLAPPEENRSKFFGFRGVLVYTVDGGVRYSKNLGQSWLTLDFLGENNTYLIASEIDVYDQNWIALAYDNFGKQYLYYSSDFIKWNKFTADLPDQEPDFRAYTLLPAENHLFIKVRTDGFCKLVKFDSSNNTFITCTGTGDVCGTGDFYTISIVANKDNLLLTTLNGLYQSYNGGLHWSRVFDNLSNLPRCYVTHLVNKNNKLYGGSYFMGIVEADWNDFPTNTSDEQESHDIQLSVLPNPGKGIFRLFGNELNSEKMDWIRIYNLQGQCVFSKQSKIQNGYQLDLSGLESGIYFLKIGSSSRMVCKIVVTE